MASPPFTSSTAPPGTMYDAMSHNAADFEDLTDSEGTAADNEQHPYHHSNEKTRTSTDQTSLNMMGPGTGHPHGPNGHALSATTSARSLRRQISPPVVSLFGGVSPDGVDAEEGLVAVRSREEEVQRQVEREKGPDPFAVRFEPGEKINPKVSDFCQLSRYPGGEMRQTGLHDMVTRARPPPAAEVQLQHQYTTTFTTDHR